MLFVVVVVLVVVVVPLVAVVDVVGVVVESYYYYIYISEVGGIVQPGNSFGSCVSVKPRLRFFFSFVLCVACPCLLLCVLLKAL